MKDTKASPRDDFVGNKHEPVARQEVPPHQQQSESAAMANPATHVSHNYHAPVRLPLRPRKRPGRVVVAHTTNTASAGVVQADSSASPVHPSSSHHRTHSLHQRGASSVLLRRSQEEKNQRAYSSEGNK